MSPRRSNTDWSAEAPGFSRSPLTRQVRQMFAASDVVALGDRDVWYALGFAPVPKNGFHTTNTD